MHLSSDSAVQVIPAGSIDQIDVIDLPVRAPGSARVASHPLRSDAVTHLTDYRDGRAEGFDAGYAAGVQAGQADLASTVASLRSVIIQLGAAQDDAAQCMADVAVELAVELATTIVRHEVATPEAFTRHVVDVARAECGQNSDVTIVMHPADASLVDTDDRVTIVTDAHRSRGFAEATMGATTMRVDPTAAIERVREYLHSVMPADIAIHPAVGDNPATPHTQNTADGSASTPDATPTSSTDATSPAPARRATRTTKATTASTTAATKTTAAQKSTAAKKTAATKKAPTGNRTTARKSAAGAAASRTTRSDK